MGLLGKIGGIFAKIKGVIWASTATKIATVSVAAVVVGGSTAGLVYADVFTSAESAVKEASQTMREEAVPSYEQIFGWDALRNAMKEQGTEFGLEITVNEISMDSLGMGGMTLPNLGIQLISRATPEQQMNLELGIKAAETTLLSASAYADKESVQVAVPKLFASVLTMNYRSENFKDEFINSYLVEVSGLSKEELEKDWKPIPEDYTAEKFLEEHGETVLKLSGVYKKLLDGTKYQKAGKLEVVVENTPVNCKVYTANVAEEALKEAMDEILPMAEEFFKGFYAGMSAKEAELFGTYEDFEKTYLDYYRNIRNVHSTTYVYNKRIVKQEVSFTIDEEKGKLLFLYAPEGNPYENMELSVLLPVPEREPVAFVYTVATELTEDAFSVDMGLTAEEEEVVLSFDYEILGGEFTLTLQNGTGEQSLELMGAVGELEIGRKIGLELYDYVYREGEYTEEQELNAGLYVKVLEDEVQPLSGTQQDVLKMTGEEFDALGKEISGNLMWMLFGIMGLMQ